MELDDLKKDWETNQAKNPVGLTPALINQILDKKYNVKINKVVYPELAGIAVCLGAALFILIGFHKLDTTFLQIVGTVTILLLLTLSIISLASLKGLRFKKDFTKPYAETLQIFAKQKLQFYKLQKVNTTLCYLLLVTTIVLMSKFINGIDLTGNKYFWTLSFTLGYIFLLFYSKMVSRYYKKVVREAEELLQELRS